MSPSSSSSLRSASQLAVVVAEHEGEQLAEVVQVLAGVVQIDDLGGFGEVLAGQVPDPVRAVAQDGQLADVAGAAAAGLGGHQGPEPGGGREGGQVGGGVRVADRVTVLIDPGLGEHAGQFHLAGAGLAVFALAGAALGLGASSSARRSRRWRYTACPAAGGRQRDHVGRRSRRPAPRSRRRPPVPSASACLARPPARTLDPGQVREQPGAVAERLGGGGPGGHLRQPPRHRLPGHPQLGVPGGQAVPALRRSGTRRGSP